MKFIQALASNKDSPALFIVSNSLETLTKELLTFGIKEYSDWRNWERIQYNSINLLSEEEQSNRILLDSKQYSDIYKYIVVAGEDSVEHLIIFPKYINHSDMYNEFVMQGEEYFNRISAGFTNLTNFSGRSETLDLDSRLQDKELFT